MRFIVLLLLVMFSSATVGCSLGRHDFLQRTAQQAIPLPDDGTNRKLDIHAHFQASNVTLTYETAKAPEQILQWYRDTLVAQGWQLASGSDADQWSAPRPNVSDRLLAQRHAVTRQRLWIAFDTRYDSGNAVTTAVRIQFESIGMLENIENILIFPIDAPLGFLDDSFPGVCWYFFWLPLKLAL
jgi:hypothetical protein